MKLLLVLMIACLLAWLWSVTHIRHPWAMVGWLPAIGLAAATFLIMSLQLIEGFAGSGTGAADGFHRIGLSMVGVPVTLLSIMFLGLGWVVRPRGDPSEGVVAAAVVVAMVPLVLFLISVVRLTAR